MSFSVTFHKAERNHTSGPWAIFRVLKLKTTPWGSDQHLGRGKGDADGLILTLATQTSYPWLHGIPVYKAEEVVCSHIFQC
jgi:hypothetical protein